MKSFAVTLFLASCVWNATGLQTPATHFGREVKVTQGISSHSKSTICHGSERRKFVQDFVAVFSASFLVAGSAPAFADVSDGNALPQGAAQFGRILRAKSDLVVRSNGFVSKEAMFCS
jgi:hypothetical protein